MLATTALRRETDDPATFEPVGEEDVVRGYRVGAVGGWVVC